MNWYWKLYSNCNLFRYLRHFFLYVLNIHWILQIIILLLAVILMIIVWKRYKNQKITRCQAFIQVVLPVYVCILFASLVFSRTVQKEFALNLRPLWTGISIISGEKKYIQTLLQNLSMLVPVGMFFPVATKATMKKTFVVGFLISVSIEVLQLVTKTGLCEVDDVIHNTLGVIIGYGVYYVAIMICKKWRSCCEGKRERKVEDEEII